MTSRRKRHSMSVRGDISLEGLWPQPEFLSRDRLTRLPKYRDVEAFVMDIPDTIPQLGYASHQFFRYYGKFPSILGREIVRRFAVPNLPVLDCYAGSGTTLVEAQIAGYGSVGVDINPLGTLACNVKTGYFDLARLDAAFGAMLSHALDVTTRSWHPSETPEKKLNKWFLPDAILELGRIRTALDALPSGRERAFLAVCFLAIVRRCSNAFDGEVRPHVNRDKRPRSPLVALKDKYSDMIAGLQELDTLRSGEVSSVTYTADNRDVGEYATILPQSTGLVVAHPPYLNSFNYLHAFGLEFMWAEGLSEVWPSRTLSEVQRLESRAWPATNAAVLDQYYVDLRAAIRAAASTLCNDGVMALVIGDATIRGRLEPVHLKAWEIMEGVGLEPQEIWFRTTHYGIGKYAYSHRADYHGQAEKKDAILFFRKTA